MSGDIALAGAQVPARPATSALQEAGPANHGSTPALVDGFGRAVTYLRLSVTDRCDLRCSYCMSEDAVFLPRRDVLSLEELYRVASTFIGLGVRKIRITGGEPLVRKNVMSLFAQLGGHLKTGGLEELVVTTNGTLLARHADELLRSGVKRVNVSLDTLDRERYRALTRWGNVDRVLNGIDTALAAGLEVKINMVARREAFKADIDAMIEFAHGRNMILTLIEMMPMGGALDEYSTAYMPLGEARSWLARNHAMEPVQKSTGGPAQYFHLPGTGGIIGFISPLGCNFCASCNRMRVSCTGELFPCMGNEGAVLLRPALRNEGNEDLEQTIRQSVAAKPKGHHFGFDDVARGGLERSMAHLGG